MILKMLQLLIVSFLLIHGSAARGLYEDLEEFDRWERQGIPGTSQPEYAPDCIKDILILWDNSYSIGVAPFTDFIKPFIKELIKSPRLNVGRHGTHIGIVSFSTQANTKVLWEVSAHPDREDLLNEVDALTYNSLKGDGTRTGMAFLLAAGLLTKPNPFNYRESVGDVVLLFTDGRPVVRVKQLGESTFGFKSETEMASHYAHELKRNNITVVSLAVGHDAEIDKFYDDIVDWSTSKDHVFRAKITDLETVLDRIVNVSCIDPGQCSCGRIFTDVYIKQGEDSAAVTWETPSLSCSSRQPNIYHTEVSPEGVKSGQSFEAGQYNITYKFIYQKGQRKTYQECPVFINVHACECLAQQTVRAVTKPGEATALASWDVPAPTCEADIKYKEFEKSEAWFEAGEHTALYVFNRKSQETSFDILCEVKIIVEACKCPPEQTVKAKVQPGQTKAYVSWKEPKPTCESALTYSEHEATDGWFSVGKYTARYDYTHENGFDIKCVVNIEVEGELCRGKAFSPDTQVCCCGEIHEKSRGHECCGMEYYNKATSKCCDKERANVMSYDENCP